MPPSPSLPAAERATTTRSNERVVSAPQGVPRTPGGTTVHTINVEYQYTDAEQGARPPAVLVVPDGELGGFVSSLLTALHDAPGERGRQPRRRSGAPRDGSCPRDDMPPPLSPSRAPSSASSHLSYVTAVSQRSLSRASAAPPPGCAQARAVSAPAPAQPEPNASVDNLNPDAPRRSPELHMHKIRNVDEYTKWYESKGKGSLEEPPEGIRRLASDPGHGRPVTIGCLHVHRHEGETLLQMWMWKGAQKKWVRVYEGARHPHAKLKGYELLLHVNGQPRWVTKPAARSYKEKRT